MIFCFYSFHLADFENVIVFVFAWCHDVMPWRQDVTKLISPIPACRFSKVMIHIYFCRYFGCWVPSYYRICTCMMFSCHNVTLWRHWNYYMTSRNELPSSQPANVLESWFLSYLGAVISLVAELNLVHGRTGSPNRPGKFSLTGRHYRAKNTNLSQYFVGIHGLHWNWAKFDQRHSSQPIWEIFVKIDYAINLNNGVACTRSTNVLFFTVFPWFHVIAWMYWG